MKNLSGRRKYQLLIALTGFLFLYILSTEIYDRWDETLKLYGELESKKRRILNPAELEHKKGNLLVEKRGLMENLTKGSELFGQNQIGVLNFLNRKSKESSVTFQALTPLETHTKGNIKEIGFTIELITSYHKLGSFVNSIETGTLPVQMSKIEMVNEKAGSQTLRVNLEGKTYVLGQGGSQ